MATQYSLILRSERSERLEGWVTKAVPVPPSRGDYSAVIETLAALAPQDEVGWLHYPITAMKSQVTWLGLLAPSTSV